MNPKVSYIICATPRSGTTLLCDLLTATGVAGAPNSYFRRQDIPRRAEAWGVSQSLQNDPEAFDRAYIDAALREGRAGTDVFGLRLMWGTLAELSARLSRLYSDQSDAAALLERAFGRIVYVHVSRDDKVAQAVSLLRAEQSGLWHVAPDGSERQRSAPPAPILYDFDRIAAYVDELEYDDAAWTSFFAERDIAPVKLSYEALASHANREIGTVLRALGVSPQAADHVGPKTARMADDESVAWSERFQRERLQRR